MCGICGFLAFDGNEERAAEAVAHAVGLLRHRGPDGSGVFRDGALALGHTRLSIIDVEGGSQPLYNEDGSIVTVFNGEIWNHRELRGTLERRGHTFSTQADTEVIVHGYEEWGDELPEQLDGMFAFALWDRKTRSLLLARDRLGKKPMYLAESDRGIGFGSDARSALLAAGLSPEVDVEAVPEFLAQRYTVAPRTLFKGVRRLQPGHAFTAGEGTGVREWPYWSLLEGDSASVDASEVRSLLAAAVRKRLMSDVPVGALLSGGVDSAAIVGLACEAGAQELQTFTIGFDDPRYDERPLARLTAEKHRTEHRELVVGPESFLDALPRLSWFRDEPIAEPSEIPLLLLSEFAGEHVKVALTGDGGDELFGGYPKYRVERLLRAVPRRPVAALSGLGRLASRLPTHRRLARAFETLAISDETTRWASWFRTFSPSEILALTGPGSSARPGASLGRVLGPYADIDPGRRMLIGDLLTYLPDNMLTRSDKVLMGASVEGRTPLLDLHLVERVALVRAGDRAAIRSGKRLFRDAVADLVPAAVLGGRKRGFPVPVAGFLFGGAEMMSRLLLSERALDRGIIRPDAIRALLAADPRRVAERDLKLFTLAALELWLRTNVDDGVRNGPPSWDEILA
jgi:asparagine synthase (glutamine-hydrolysing)